MTRVGISISHLVFAEERNFVAQQQFFFQVFVDISLLKK